MIEDSTPPFEFSWDGSFGFAPYRNDSLTKYSNFMYNLKSKGYVDHNVISLNLYNTMGNSSSIKFGSYDASAVAPNFDN